VKKKKRCNRGGEGKNPASPGTFVYVMQDATSGGEKTLLAGDNVEGTVPGGKVLKRAGEE